jgi:hypothetical protein
MRPPQYGKRRQAGTGKRYAERTADYAFGMAGDVDLAKNERYRELWRKIEGIRE